MWIKKDNRRKSQVFICPKCKQECICINYDGKINICNYRYCPYCGNKIEQIVNNWNNDASHSFEDMCKINEILKE